VSVALELQRERSRVSMAKLRARRRRWPAVTLNPERLPYRRGHCLRCGLRSLGELCAFCLAELEGRPTPRVD
jgi:hypothetical protein